MKLSRDLLIGRWYRQDINEQGQQIIEYADMAADGSFEFTFITQNTGAGIKSIEEEVMCEHQITELGDWGLVGDIHFTLTKNEIINSQLYAADLNDSENYHAYRVLQLNHKIFEYQHIVSNEVFIMRRVIDNIGHC